MMALIHNEYHKSKDNAIDFVNLIKKYIGIKELTYEILHELIDRIEVGEKYEYQGETYFTGYTKEYVKVAVKGDKNLSNTFVSGTITGHLTEEIYLLQM